MSNVQHRCCEVNAAFGIELKSNQIRTLQDAEKWLEKVFEVDVHNRNKIEFDFVFQAEIYEEQLYEYKIEEPDGSYRTFYIDKGLGFECQCNLPPTYKDIVSELHKEAGS
jgi:hypothetical protein